MNVRRKTVGAAASLVAMLGTVLFLAAPVAQAQTGYPPGVCTTTTGAQDAGGHLVGDTFTINLAPVCTFVPGTSVTVVVNGVNIPGKTANAQGFVTVTVRINSQTEILIDDPVRVPAQCGTNTVVATGASPSGVTVSQTGTFQLLCPRGAATPVQGRVAFTGANIARWSAVALALVMLGGTLVVADRRRVRSKA